MARVGLNRTMVVQAAAELADEVGVAHLTMAALAKRLGIALPSLYAHVRNLEHLRQHISALANEELGQQLGMAIQGRSRADALAAIAATYRTYALRFPGRYAASQLPPDLSDPQRAAALAQAAYAASQRASDLNDPRHRAGGLQLIHAIYATIRGYGLEEPDLTDAVRVLRSALHGFVTLEQTGGFALPQSLDVSFQHLVEALDRSFQSWPTAAPGEKAFS